MTTLDTTFYKSGGTLSPDDPSYVRRNADVELHERLLDGQFCYVLTSRQMGKSSLMTQTAAQLEQDGVVVAELDLTSIGQNLTLEQWYDELVYEMGRRIRLKPQLRAAWEANQELGPLQRFLGVLRDGLLAHFAGPVVIFIDEIEVVRSLPFSTDEFFAAIRECYNLRASDTEIRRLSFCLFGMALPQDLIQDTQITPFNIGRRIDLTDFTFAEAKPLAKGMSAGRDGERLLRRVLYWTSGQPYLTQRLCQSIAERPAVVSEQDVDKLCGELFLSERARQSEANLVPLREFLLRSSSDRAGLLLLYQKILKHKRTNVDPTDPHLAILKLSGVVRITNGRPALRNRIYARVFDKVWIRTSMPDAELQRQRAAARRAIAQASAFYGVIIIAMGYLAWLAYTGQLRAEHNYQLAQQNLYVADINLAKQALDNHDIAKVLALLKQHAGDPLRGFEYGYLWRQCHQEYFTCTGDTIFVDSVSFSPDARYLATASVGGTIRIWDRLLQRQVRRLSVPRSYLIINRYSPDGSALAYTDANSIHVVDTRTWQSRLLDSKGSASIQAINFSPDGRYFAAGGANGKTILYDAHTWRRVRILQAASAAVYAVSFAPNGSHDLATAGADTLIRIWNSDTGTLEHTIAGHNSPVRAIAFSSTGSMLAAGGEDKFITIHDTRTWRLTHILGSEGQIVHALQFVPGTDELSVAGDNSSIKLWDVVNQAVKYTYDGHLQPIHDLAISGDGHWLASASWDNTAKIWDILTPRFNSVQIAPNNMKASHWTLSRDASAAAAVVPKDRLATWKTSGRAEPLIVERFSQPPSGMSFSRGNGDIAVAGVDGLIVVYDRNMRDERWQVSIPAQYQAASALALSRDGKSLAVGTVSGDILIWDKPGRLVAHYSPARTSIGGHAILGLDFSPDDNRLAVGDQDTLRILFLKGSKKQLTVIAAGVTAVSFSPDGADLAAGGFDGSVSFWNLEAQQIVLTLVTGEQAIASVAFSADGQTVEAVSLEGTLRKWTARGPN